MNITMSHGAGGQITADLIKNVFFKYFKNNILEKCEDGAILNLTGKIAYTTDSFVVEPIIFNGGDIGKLAICGTVNDLCAMGAIPKFLTASFIIGEGFPIELLEKIVKSMSETAKETGVLIVAGDTKVVETKGIFVNTSGIGEVFLENISISNSKAGDRLILTGNLGDHQVAIMSKRMEIENDIKSDVAPLVSLVTALKNIPVHTMRDVTRGGLATVLHELCEQSKCGVNIYENTIPVNETVKGFCNVLGLEPIYMGNEGKMLISVPENYADKALDIVKKCKYCEDAVIIGEVVLGNEVIFKTNIGSERILKPMYSEGLPRIC
ncbi:MAG: hydrogenase expression/formation protein HypE [Oscillospiraceae bacterium]|jgi:hydrogenase expression/formation protein HypE|nr:hydrogenase expression/formation protein HypE [Oscillospiraceae bacterium]